MERRSRVFLFPKVEKFLDRDLLDLNFHDIGKEEIQKEGKHNTEITSLSSSISYPSSTPPNRRVITPFGGILTPINFDDFGRTGKSPLWNTPWNWEEEDLRKETKQKNSAEMISLLSGPWGLPSTRSENERVISVPFLPTIPTTPFL